MCGLNFKCLKTRTSEELKIASYFQPTSGQVAWFFHAPGIPHKDIINDEVKFAFVLATAWTPFQFFKLFAGVHLQISAGSFEKYWKPESPVSGQGSWFFKQGTTAVSKNHTFDFWSIYPSQFLLASSYTQKCCSALCTSKYIKENMQQKNLHPAVFLSSSPLARTAEHPSEEPPSSKRPSRSALWLRGAPPKHVVVSPSLALWYVCVCSIGWKRIRRLLLKGERRSKKTLVQKLTAQEETPHRPT